MTDTDPGSDQALTDGLYSPDSVTWRVHADPLLGVAGMRALLLQVLDPRAMSAHRAHSWTGIDFWHRLTRTTQYVAVTTYGSTTEAMMAGARLRARHATVVGVTADGRQYAADDPELLVWTHCCLVDSFLRVVVRGGMPMTARQADAYVAEQVRAATIVGLEPDEVPNDLAGLQAYFKATQPRLGVTAEARVAASRVVAPPLRAVDSPAPTNVHRHPGADALRAPGPGRGAVGDRSGHAGPARRPDSAQRPPWAAMAGLAYAVLPGWARRLYALPALPGTAGLSSTAATLALRALRTTMTSGISTSDGVEGPDSPDIPLP